MSGKDPTYFPIWPYYFLAGLAFLIALVVLIIWKPPWHPDTLDLVEVEGAITKVEIRDDLSDTTAGAVWPMLTSVYFTLEGSGKEFRYPFSHPDYFLVRDHTSGRLKVLVDKSEMETDQPAMIWQIEEDSDYSYFHPNTVISFATISSHSKKVSTANLRLISWLTLASAGLIVTGKLVGRWNRHRGAQPWV